MINALLFSGILLIISVLSSKLLYRFGIPTLLIFISLGMLLGSDGIGGIYFDNYEIAQQLSTLSLVWKARLTVNLWEYFQCLLLSGLLRHLI